MISLILAVLSSALVSIVMRLSTGRVKYDLGMLTMNYIVCTLLSGLFTGVVSVVDFARPYMGLTVGMGAINGILFLAGFVLMQLNVQRNGVVLSSIFQKLGLLVTLLVSVVFYREIPTVLQGTGFLIAMFSIFLMNYRKEGQTAGFKAGLIGMLLACGMADAMAKVFTESVAASLEPQFLFYTFVTAALCCAVYMLQKGQKIGRKEMLYGTMIALPNFFSAKFLLGALERLPAVIVYPAFSVGTILVVTMTGVLAFRERLLRNQWAGMAAILVALVLLNV